MLGIVSNESRSGVTRVTVQGQTLFTFRQSTKDGMSPSCPHLFRAGESPGSSHCPKCGETGFGTLLQAGKNKRSDGGEESGSKKHGGKKEERPKLSLPADAKNYLSLCELSECVASVSHDDEDYVVVVAPLEWTVKADRKRGAKAIVNLLQEAKEKGCAYVYPEGTEKENLEQLLHPQEKLLPEVYSFFHPLKVLSAWILPTNSVSDAVFAGVCTYMDNLYEGTPLTLIRDLLARSEVDKSDQLAPILLHAVKTEDTDREGLLARVAEFLPESDEEEKKAKRDGDLEAILQLWNTLRPHYDHDKKAFDDILYSQLVTSKLDLEEQGRVDHPFARIYHMLVEPHSSFLPIDQLLFACIQQRLLTSHFLEDLPAPSIHAVSDPVGRASSHYRMAATPTGADFRTQDLIAHPIPLPDHTKIGFSLFVEVDTTSPRL